jgi:3-oxoacyl-(acyl-carrier-protein) synthase
MDSIVVTGIGLCTPLGGDPWKEIQAGRSAVMVQPNLVDFPMNEAAVIDKIDLRPWLQRRKDKKLMARPAQLALAAAGPALADWTQDRSNVGIYLGVGREPGDDGESEPALVASQVDGKLSAAAVAGRCRDLYPPLLPLKTLPNMALAHICIHMGVQGENGAWCGGSAAGLTALRAGMWSVLEGRADAALISAADTWVSQGAVRDLHRMASGTLPQAPGEAGVALLIEKESDARSRGTQIFGRLSFDGPFDSPHEPFHRASLGDCHAADGLLAVALSISSRKSQCIVTAKEAHQPAVGVMVEVDEDFACYAPVLGGPSS